MLVFIFLWATFPTQQKDEKPNSECLLYVKKNFDMRLLLSRWEMSMKFVAPVERSTLWKDL